MSNLYKLTNSWGKTQNDTQWGPGVYHSGTGEGELCGPGWIHAYEHPLIAVLMNPIHADFENPRLWEAEGEIAIRDGQLKCGCATLTTIREIPLPEITTEMRVRAAILSTKCVLECRVWNAWADKWLSGEDRTQAAAEKAEKAKEAAAWRWSARAGLRAAQAAAAAAEAAKEDTRVAKEAKKAAAYAAATAVEWAAKAVKVAAAEGAAELDLAGWLDAHGAGV